MTTQDNNTRQGPERQKHKTRRPETEEKPQRDGYGNAFLTSDKTREDKIMTSQ
jgi:hypothetical protein